MNYNIAILDAALAGQEFAAAGHEHALFSSKTTDQPGKVVQTLLEKLNNRQLL